MLVHSLITFALGSLVAISAAIPITPSAPRFQKHAEQYRLEGMGEFEIAQLLAHTPPPPPRHPLSIFHLFTHPPSHAPLDNSGDIPPGSLESPSMLPRPAIPPRRSLFRKFLCLLMGEKGDGFGYEGREGEIRRPTGMRYWRDDGGWEWEEY